jgi:hypothetical protein
MKRIGRALVAVAMMAGVLGAAGCKKSDDQRAPQESAPVAQPTAEAPKAEAPAAAKEEATTVIKATATTQLPAPPALRVENSGPAPSTRHVWRRGYWRWNAPTTVYVWESGYWEDPMAYAPYAPPALRVEDPGYAPADGYFFVPGYWRWSGREYAWTYGHWSLRRDSGLYYRPRWERVNGRWEPRMERWGHQQRVVWEREHPTPGHREHEHREHEHRAQGHEHRAQEHGTQEHRDHERRNDGDARRAAVVKTERPAEHRAPVQPKPSTGALTPARRGHG